MRKICPLGFAVMAGLLLTGCGDDDGDPELIFFNDVAITVDRAPIATIEEKQNALLARLDITGLAEDVRIHEIGVTTSLPTYGAFVTTKEGVTGKTLEVDPFQTNNPAALFNTFPASSLRIFPQGTQRTSLLFVEKIRQTEQLSIYFNTLGLDGEVVHFSIDYFVVSSIGAPPHTLGVPDMDFTLLVTAPPIVQVDAIRPQRVHVSRGADVILAEMTATELSNEHAVAVQLVVAKLDRALIGLDLTLVDSFGNILGPGIRDPADPRIVFFDLGLGRVLTIPPGEARRMFIVGDLRPFSGINNITLEVPRVSFENDNGEVKRVDGPIDPTTKNLVQFVNTF